MKQNLKKIIEELLREDQRCRTDNNWLVLQTLRKLGFNLYINYGEMYKMPPFDSIIRTKRMIQHQENKYHDRLPQEGVTYEKPITHNKS